ncbi:MAG: hemolysin family protein [Candidatus Krumholzibacteria bacterium]|nr:hemolysin family protein [Candidatus Krumholzibacteria bacterium]MDH4336030.1 hemolysin family protein [Candidatus Krumholzibacteria bacterium]MDH5268394.1 hemolysin family protein [Candidatus Krumholzibacteria bacterium]
MSDRHLIIISVVAFVLGIFYSGSETAFIAADRLRLRHLADAGDRRARRVLALLENPRYLLSSVLVGTNLAIIGCTTTFTALMARHYGTSGATLATLILVPVTLIFNEVIPKGLFLYYSTRAALGSVDILRVLTGLLYPLVRTFTFLSDVFTRFLPISPSSRLLNVSMEELLFHIGDSRGAGLIAPETTELIDRAIELKDLSIRDAMTPLEVVLMLDGDVPFDDQRGVIAHERFSRYPVYRGQRNNVVGVISVHEFVTAHDREALRRNLQPPYAVPENARLSDVLLQMREGGRHMALIRRPDGTCVGMTTLDDILKRLVGVIVDEFD